jgi:YggT family protein
MFFPIYQFIYYAVVAVVLFAIVVLGLRLLFNYIDPNPFGTIGKFVYFLKKKTDDWVRPSANLLARGGIDTRIAPLVTILGLCLVAWFSLQLVWNVLFTINGVVTSAIDGRIVALVGYILYGVLAVYSLLIVCRIIFSWFVSYLNPIMRFLVNATEPILGPFRRMIPPLGGMIDISPIVVLFLMNLLQMAVVGVLINSPMPF